MTANVYQLLHLPHIVASFGPLNVYSYFPCEGFTGSSLNFIKGTQHAEIHITEAVCKIQTLLQMAQTVLCTESEPAIFYHQVIAKKALLDHSSFVGSNCIQTEGFSYQILYTRQHY